MARPGQLAREWQLSAVSVKRWRRSQTGRKSKRGRGTEPSIIFGLKRCAEILNRSDGAGLDAWPKKIYIFYMKHIASVSTLQAGVSKLIKRTEAEGIVPVSRNGRTVVFMVSRDKMAALLETMELQKDSGLMALVKQDRSGKVKYSEVPVEI